MTGRDRMVVIGVVVLVALAGAWLLVVSPKRQQASKLAAQVAEAKSQLTSAETKRSEAQAAQAKYASAYSSVISLGKAVPPTDEVPSLIYQLSLASDRKSVDFSSIVASSTGTGGTGGASSTSSSTPTTSGASSGASSGAAAPTAFTQMPFTFVFNGTFFNLEHLFQQLNDFTVRNASGILDVSGRLLTIQSIKLGPLTSSSSQTSASRGPQLLTGTITASAYVLPASQGLTSGATPSSPAGATTPVSSTSGASSSPTAPAVARVTP